MAQIAILAVMAVGALAKGAQQRKLAYGEAEGLRQASMRKAAASTAEVGQGKNTKEFMESRMIALAAAQGGGLGDPSMVKLLADLNTEGEYHTLSKLYTGMGEAAGMQYASGQAMDAGDIAMEQGYMNAATTVLSQYGNFGAMWSEAKEQFAWAKDTAGTAYNKFRLGRQQKKLGDLGMHDIYKPGSTAGYS